MNKINRVIKKKDKSPKNDLSLNLEIQSSDILEREKLKDLEFSKTANVNCITSVTELLGKRGQSWAAGRQGRRRAALWGLGYSSHAVGTVFYLAPHSRAILKNGVRSF